jgi:hypothetical protein
MIFERNLKAPTLPGGKFSSVWAPRRSLSHAPGRCCSTGWTTGLIRTVANGIAHAWERSEATCASSTVPGTEADLCCWVSFGFTSVSVSRALAGCRRFLLLLLPAKRHERRSLAHTAAFECTDFGGAICMDGHRPAPDAAEGRTCCTPLSVPSTRFESTADALILQYQQDMDDGEKLEPIFRLQFSRGDQHVTTGLSHSLVSSLVGPT